VTNKNLAAKFLALALASMSAQAAVIDETGPAGPTTPMGPGSSAAGGAPLGAGENRAMRTTVSLGAIQAAFDNSDPRSNVERFKYDSQMTYKLRLREFMAVTVVLPPGEVIDGFLLADEKNFTFKPYSAKDCRGSGAKCKDEPDPLSNVFSVTPQYPGADTNLTIFGRSRRVYSFYLRADNVKSLHLPHLVVYIDAPAGSVIASGGTSATADAGAERAIAEAVTATGTTPGKMTGEDAADLAEYLRSLPLIDPKAVNLNAYKVVDGEKALAPIRVFDDGYWTYFQYSKDGNLDKTKVPAIYRVVDGYDTPANTRIEGGTVIAETVSKGWTIRAGEAHLCVRSK